MLPEVFYGFAYRALGPLILEDFNKICPGCGFPVTYLSRDHLDQAVKCGCGYRLREMLKLSGGSDGS